MLPVNLGVFVFGAFIGSFLNVCIARIPEGRSIVFPPSHCSACGHNLGFVDLVPILNYIYLGGKCRRCGAGIPLHHPLVEVITGVLFLLVWLRFGVAWSTVLGWLMVGTLVTAAAVDIHHRIIPDAVVLTGLVAGMLLAALVSWQSLKLGLAGFVAAGAVMLLIALLSRGGMGGGDIKLAALMGLYLGPRSVGVALMLAFLAGGLVGIALLASGLKGRKDAIPFGPYLAFGGVVALLWGNRLVNWYLGLWS